MINKNVFAERLREQRLLKGFTQKEMAEAIGVSERSYLSYEARDDATMPSLKYLFAIAEKLCISIDYLLNRTSNPLLN